MTSELPAVDPRALVVAFLRAFRFLDLPRFIAHFTEDASAFFPAPEPPTRVDGRAAIEARFALVFAGIRAAAEARGIDAPPWHRLDAIDLAIAPLGTQGDAAVATFELRDELRTARRTLVLVRQDGTWRIAHLHASNGVPVA